MLRNNGTVKPVSLYTCQVAHLAKLHNLQVAQTFGTKVCNLTGFTVFKFILS